MSIKKLLNFSNGFYFLSALVFFAVVGVAGLHLKSTMIQVDNQIVYLNNIHNIYAQGVQKGQSTRNILLNPHDTKAMRNYKDAAYSMNESFNQCFSIATPTQKTQLKKLKELLSKDDALQLQVQSLAESGKQKEAYGLLVTEETPTWRKAKSFVLDLVKKENKNFQDIKYSMESAMALTIIVVGAKHDCSANCSFNCMESFV